MQKASGTNSEQKEVWSIAKRVPGRWNTIDAWQKQAKKGVPYEKIWDNLPSNMQGMLLEILTETLSP
jgi:hypothetical protein